MDGRALWQPLALEVRSGDELRVAASALHKLRVAGLWTYKLPFRT
jgi:hypothetical protein